MKYKKNADGTDMLDSEGNPIPEENTNEGETITPEEAKLLKESLANTVEELKVKRKEAADYKQKFEDATRNPNPLPNDETKIAEVVKKVISEEKMSSVKTEKEKAFERFITENKEFHPDNDPTGEKREALKAKLSRFNTDSIVDIGEYYDVIREAQLLLTGTKSNTSEEVQNPYSSSPQSRMTPNIVVKDKLTPAERKLVDRGATTEEYILKLREKRPGYLRQLLKQVE